MCLQSVAFLALQELFRKVRSILNKLTPQMFHQLMKQVTDLTINTEERLKGVIDLVFEKAIDEPSFSAAYANMCRCLATVRSVHFGDYVFFLWTVCYFALYYYFFRMS